MYCIDMLKKKEYRYLEWETDGVNCEFTFKHDKMPEETIYENCFYSTNKFLQNLRNYCNWNEIEMPKDQLEAAMKLLGVEDDWEEVRKMVQCLVTKDEKKMKTLTNNPIEVTIPILQEFSKNIKIIDKFYKKKESGYGERVLQKSKG